MKKILASIFIIVCFLSTNSSAEEDTMDTLNAKDFSLMLCLSNNYNKLDKSNISPMNNDASTLSQKYSSDAWSNIMKFVEDNTSNYYDKAVMVHFEEEPDQVMNIIFSKCMEFYHSKKIDNFIKNNKY
ncbi:hypothetical protein HYE59_09315 [Aggregatibacter actinomycetemcomitans]|uniref:hypothetical protein n=1 Tax=Aggregatibacter actinomycetemcomitans TaxID=714 RepID=UPI00197B39FB|nr:hypothetical protein [Aggregatibacter actinomycetemcomitans]MBN6075551.1 hypothetical protein [Aggregatibacter actinomycetemcomitans]MBN6077725.1 hypothetical protein [Aggregatibacter actinomycetemcomitans]